MSGGLVALGLIATATRVGTAVYAFGLVLLPRLRLSGCAVLAGSAVGLLAAVASEHSLAAALAAGGVVAVAAVAAMMSRQQPAWERATSGPVNFDEYPYRK